LNFLESFLKKGKNDLYDYFLIKKIMKKSSIFIGLFVLMTASAFADAASMGGDGNTLQIMDSNEIQMVDEVINIDVYSGDKDTGIHGTVMGGYVEVEVLYTFKNLMDEAVTVNMGFPEDCSGTCYLDSEDWAPVGNDEVWESYKLYDFEALDGDEPLDVTVQHTIIDEYYEMNWYLFDVEFDAGEEKQITNKYWIKPWRYRNGQWFDYILETGASWAGEIERVDIYVNFEEDILLYDVNEVSPSGYDFNIYENSIEWTDIRDLEPTEDDNIYVRYGENYTICGDFELNASSYLPDDETSEGSLFYWPCQVGDGDLDTSWVEGVAGDGVGEWVRISLSEDKIYYGFDIFAGYGESEELWEKNNRVKKVRLNFSNGETGEVDLVDVYDYQNLSFNQIMSGLTYVDVEILDVYEGTDYDDTAIAEIYFQGLLAEGVEGISVGFTDITSSHPNVDAILALKNWGVIDGYGDGSFKPDGSINRAELMKMVVEMAVGDPNELGVYEYCFSDVEDDWYAPYVCYAFEQGWVDGYGDGTFKPGNKTNRVEAIKIIINAFYNGELPEFDNDVLLIGSVPYDVDEGAWYFPYVEVALVLDVLDYQHAQSSHDGLLYFPGEDMTRKEVAEMIYRLVINYAD
jgi:hypothetical protein